MRRTLLISLFSFAALIVGGYGLAYWKLSDCGDDFLQELQSLRVKGTTLAGGSVSPSATMAIVRVAGPFVVDATMTIPRDLHVATYSARYLALPWGIQRVSFGKVRYV